MKKESKVGRRDFLRGTAVAGAAGAAWMAAHPRTEATVWQIDPAKCLQCGQCATACVQTPSAVKCVHSYQICGYCDLCSGYLQPGAKARDSGAENELCPVGALKRIFVEEPFYQYTVDEKLCVGCGKCVKGCGVFGNGSLYLQVKHDLCLGCNECSIARNCPANAFRRIPARTAYLLKTGEHGGKEQK